MNFETRLITIVQNVIRGMNISYKGKKILLEHLSVASALCLKYLVHRWQYLIELNNHINLSSEILIQ